MSLVGTFSGRGPGLLRRLPAFAVALMIGAPWAYAESGRWERLSAPLFHPLGGESQLPAGRVPAIAQDESGFLWLVTTGGLMRWDGFSFSRFEADYPDIDNDVRVLRSGPDGRLWIGTGRGLYRFNPATEEVQPMLKTHETAVAVLSIDFADRGSDLRVWLGTERGVFELEPSSGKSVAYLRDELAADPTLRTFSVLVDAQGRVWAGTSKGLYRRDAEGDGFHRRSLTPLSPETRISGLLQVSDGSVWVATARRGLVVFRPDDRVDPLPIDDFAGEWIFSLAELQPGVVWLGTYGRGIAIVTDGGVRRVRHHPLLPHGLPHDEVWSLHHDGSGRMWVGTSRGAVVHDANIRNVRNIFGGIGPRGYLRHQEITSLLETQSGELFVGLGENGVDILHPAKGKVGQIDTDPARPAAALPSGSIEALAQLPNGDVIVGSNWGTYRFRNGELARLKTNGRGDVFTGSILYHNQLLWAGGTDGLWQFGPIPELSAALPVLGSTTEAFTDPRISTLVASRDGGVIVGTWNGIYWIDGDGVVSSRIPASGDASLPLDNGYITGIVEDASGRTWFGTSGAGVYVRESVGPLRRLTRQDGLTSDLIAGLQRDSSGRIWISTGGGLSLVEPDSLTVTSLGPADGVVAAPYIRQASLRTRTGEILFGGDGGLTIIDANQWDIDPPAAQLRISAVRVAGKRVPGHHQNTNGVPIVIPADGNELAVDLAGSDLLAAPQLRFRTRLNGLDGEWKVLPRGERRVSFDRLPPGEYRLEAEVSDRYGRWIGGRRELALSVLPLWHQTAWARTIFLIMAVLTMAAVMRWRTATLRQRQRQLETLVAQRTRELEEKSRALEQASLTDPLTGMHNRRFLEQQLPAELAMSERGYFGALGQIVDGADLVFFLVDLDDFKVVNDRYGHAVGDAVLIQMRERLEAEFRKSDYLVRWGGEEFLAVARRSSRAYASRVADRLVRRVQSLAFTGGNALRLELTCSVGYCALPLYVQSGEAMSWPDYVRIADHALYAAKRAGRNAWVGVTAGRALESSDDFRSVLVEPHRAVEDGLVVLESSVGERAANAAWSSVHAERIEA